MRTRWHDGLSDALSVLSITATFQSTLAICANILETSGCVADATKQRVNYLLKPDMQYGKIEQQKSHIKPNKTKRMHIDQSTKDANNRKEKKEKQMCRQPASFPVKVLAGTNDQAAAKLRPHSAR
jgi:hypothetical protein